ncbi:MAG TPA: ThuA domain-containing protein [Pirellulales bacterium]|nr:ThuA domain-containing protein [Pirellulales bacterium]
MSQPFDTDTFHEIAVPPWVEETIGCGYTLSVMDGPARQRAATHGVTISEMGFVDPFYAYYDSKLLKRRSPHVPLARLAGDIAEYKRLGVRILGVYPPCLQGEVYENHPEWRRIATNTTEIPETDLKQFPHGGMLCLLGPYGDFFIDVLAEIVTRFPDVDAFSFDGLHYGGVCYCQHCRESYRKAAGAEIPAADMNDAAFRRYQHWADRQMEDLVRRMQTRLKGIKPSLALVTWTTNAGRFGHFLSIPRNMPARMNLLLDAPDQEFWLDETNRGTTIVPAFANAYIWAATNHRVAFSEPYILSHGNPYGKDSFPPQEILRRMMLALSYGAAPSIAVAQPANLQQELYDCLDEVIRRKPWLTHKRPEPWAALVMSDNTRNFYGRSAGQVEERYMANVFGTFRAAVEEHLPVTVINDWNLNHDDLARYKLLVLPNTACLDEAQVAAVREFVSLGGGLVASLDASLFDEFGDARNNFALADVFGVDYRGLPDSANEGNQDLDVNFAQSIGPDYWEKRNNVFDFKQDVTSLLNQGRMKTYVGGESVTFKGPAVRVATRAESAEVIGTLRAKSVASAPEMPGVVTNTFGKGRVVYFAAGFDAAYYLYAYPYQRLALKHAVAWAASDTPPLAVEAPMCVHSTIMRQEKDGSQRLLVHLFNDLNTTAHHALPVDDVPLREEFVPIHDIRLTFDRRYRFTRLQLEPEGRELKFETAPTGTIVVVPRLDVHAIVVGELEGEALGR